MIYAFIGLAVLAVIAMFLLFIEVFRNKGSMLYLIGALFSLIGVIVFGYAHYCILVPTVDEIMMSSYQSDFSQLEQNSDKLNSANTSVSDTGNDTTSTTEESMDTVITPEDSVVSETQGDKPFYTDLDEFMSFSTSDSSFGLTNYHENEAMSYVITDISGNELCNRGETILPSTSTSFDLAEYLPVGTTEVTITVNYYRVLDESGNIDTEISNTESKNFIITIE